MAKVRIVKKGGFFGKFVALLLGIVIGIVGGIGGLAFGVYYGISAFKISEILGLVESTGTDIPAEEYVSEEYLDKTILEAIQSASGLITGVIGGQNTFGDLQTISPYVATGVGELTAMLGEYGLEITQDELLAMSVPDVGPYFQGQITNIELAGLFELFGTPADPDNALVCALLYGEKGVNYTVVEETDDSDPPVVTKRIEKLPLEYLFEDNTFIDWKDGTYTNNGTTWSNEDGSIVIKANATESTSDDVTISYLYEVYQVQKGEEGSAPTETLLYKLALKADTTNVYNAYKNDEIVKHKATTIASLSNTANLMDSLYGLPIVDLLMLDAGDDPMILALAGYEVQGSNLVLVKDAPTTVNDLITNGSNLVQDLEIATVLNLNKNNANSIDKMQRAIAFGVEGEDYDIVDNAIQMKPGKTPKKISELDSSAFGSMKIGDLMNVSGSSKILNLLKDTKIDNISQMIEDLTFGDVVEIPETNPPKIMTFLKDKKINELSGVITNLTLGDAIEVTADAPKILKVLQNKKITELSTAIADLALSDVIDGAEDNMILKHLADTKVTELGTKMGDLTIQQIFCDDVYQKGYFAVNATNKTLTRLYTKEGDTNYYTDEACATVYTQQTGDVIEQYFLDKDGKPLAHEPTDSAYYLVTADGVTETTGKPVLTGKWLFLLTTDCTPETEVDYKLTDTGHLIDNMTKNVQNSTLSKLKDAGLIQTEVDLGSPRTTLHGASLGELTLIQLIEKLGNLP